MASWYSKIPTWAWIAGGVAVVGGVALWGLSAAAAVPPPLTTGARRVLVLGDSLTVGYKPYLPAALAADDQVIGDGWTSAQIAAIRAKAADYYGQAPTHVVIFAGWNDIAGSNRSAADIYAALAAFWSEAKSQTNAKVIAVMLTPCSAAMCKTNAQRIADLNTMIANAPGGSDGVDAVVDTSSLSAGNPHYSAAGYKALAALVAGGLP